MLVGLSHMAQAHQALRPSPEVVRAEAVVEVAEPADQQSSSPAAVAVVAGEGPNIHNGVSVPEGECVGEARSRLAGGQPAESLVSELKREALRRAEKDPRMIEAFASWSGCMKKTGFNLRDPWSANDNPLWKDEPDQAEVLSGRR